MPNEAFFHWNPELLCLGRQIGQINSGAFVVFSAKLSWPILVQWVPCPCFLLIDHYFYKKPSFYIHILNVYYGSAKNYGFNLHVSVVHGEKQTLVTKLVYFSFFNNSRTRRLQNFEIIQGLTFLFITIIQKISKTILYFREKF